MILKSIVIERLYRFMGLDQDLKIIEGKDKLTLIPNESKTKIVLLIIPVLGLVLYGAVQVHYIDQFVYRHYTFSISDLFWVLGLPILVYLLIIFGLTRLTALRKMMRTTPIFYYSLVVTVSIVVTPSAFYSTPFFSFDHIVTKSDFLYLFAFNNFALIIYLTLTHLALSLHSTIILEKRGKDILGYSYYSYYILPFVKIQNNLTYKSLEPNKMRFFLRDWTKERNVKLGDEAEIYSSYSYTFDEFLNLKETPRKYFILGLYGPLEQDARLIGTQILISSKKKDILDCIQRISRFCEVEIVKVPASFLKSYLTGEFKYIPAKEGESPEQILTDMKT